MKYIKRVKNPSNPHQPYYEMQISEHELKVLDLFLAMYSPFMANAPLALLGGNTLKKTLKNLRMGVNQVKADIYKAEGRDPKDISKI